MARKQATRGFGLEQGEMFAASKSPPENFGVSLVGTYIVWMAIAEALCPLCRWFARVKHRRRYCWLSYL